ncbi:MAG: hypothetical protein GY799_30605, partial [Desulfobulbaceae bacterium]|nr:hypothetical protein [Desulfobulbaceae bacterium]
NTYTTSDQEYPSIAALPNGGFVIAWHSVGQDGSGSGVYMKRFPCGDEGGDDQDLTGEACSNIAEGTEKLVNTYTTSYQWYPSVATLADGSYVITWTSNAQDGDVDGIYAQRYYANGNAIGNEFQVNTETTDDQASPYIAAFNDGGFIITWHSEEQDGSSWGIYAQQYDANGNTVDNEFRVNTNTTSLQANPYVTSLADNGFVIAWQDISQDGDFYGIYAQQYDANGNTIGSEFLVNTETANSQSSPTIAGLTIGGYVITWSSLTQDGDANGIYAQRYDANGATVGSEFQVNTETASDQSSPHIAALTGGGFIITWESFAQDGSNYGIYAQMYDSNGNTVGSEFLINTTTSDHQREPRITTINGGGFIIAWQSNYNLYAQQFDVNGNKVGSEFLVNTYTTDTQTLSSLAPLSDGGYVITWQSDGQDGSDYGVYMKQYPCMADDDNDPNTACNAINVGNEFKLTTENSVNQNSAKVVELNNGNLAAAWYTELNENAISRLFDKDGNALTPEVIVDDTDAITQKDTDITALKSGGYVIVWQDDTGETDIYAQIFSSNGSKTGGKITINSDTFHLQHLPSITALSNGGFAVTWININGSALNVDVFTDSGTRLISNAAVNASAFNTYAQPNIAALSNDNLIVVWQATDVSGAGVHGRIFDKDGNAITGEFDVNTYTAGDQKDARVTALSDGMFVIAYTSEDEIRFQRFNANGTKAGAETVANTYTTDIQSNPEITTINGGRFVIGWRSNGQDGTAYGAYYAVFENDGTKLGEEFTPHNPDGSSFAYGLSGLRNGGFITTWGTTGAADDSNNSLHARIYPCNDGSDDNGVPDTKVCNAVKPDIEALVNTTTTDDQLVPEILQLNNGYYIVAWKDAGQGGHMYGQLFDATGAKIGDEFQMSTTHNVYHFFDMAALANNNFIVVWDSWGSDGDDGGIVGQRFDTNGNKIGTEFAINTTYVNKQITANVTATKDGGFFAIWETTSGDAQGIFGQRFDPTGEKIGAEILITTSVVAPSVTELSNENVVIAYQANGDRIYARIIDKNGDLVGSEFLLSTDVNTWRVLHDIDTLNNGNFIASWLQNDGDGRGIIYRIFEPNGTPVTGELIANTTLPGDQDLSDIAVLNGEKFIIMWQSPAQDSSGSGVYGRIFKDDGTSISGEFLVNTTTDLDQTVVSVSPALDGGFAATWLSLGQDVPAEADRTGVYMKVFPCVDTEQEEIDAGTPCNNIEEQTEFQVNTYTADNQENLDITTLENGNVAIIWRSNQQNGHSIGGIARIFDPDGNPISNEIDTGRDQGIYRDVVPLPGGGFIATSSPQIDGDSLTAAITMFDDSGNITNGPIQTNTYTTNAQYSPSVAVLKNRRIIVTWVSTAQDAGADGLYGQLLDQFGNLIGTEFQINETNAARNHRKVLALNNGGFIVTYDNWGSEIYYRIYDNNAVPVTSELVAFDSGGTSQLRARTSKLSDGTIVLAWKNDTIASMQLINEDGTLAGSKIDVEESEYVDVATLTGDNIILVYSTSTANVDGSGRGIFGQLFDKNLNRIGAKFQINDYTIGDQNMPNVTALKDGGFAVAWQSDVQDGDGTGIYAKMYTCGGSGGDLDGGPGTACNSFNYSGERQVNTYVTIDQLNPAIAVLKDNRSIVVWQSDTQDGDGYGIYGQMFDENGGKIGSEFLVNDNTAGNQSAPSIAALTNGGFVISWTDASSGLQTYAEIRNASGAIIKDDYIIGDGTEAFYNSDVIGTPDGGFISVQNAFHWEMTLNYTYVSFRIFDSAGNPKGNNIAASVKEENNPNHLGKITVQPNGDYIIAWESGRFSREISAQRYDANDNAIGAIKFVVNSITDGDQTYPSIASLSDGSFLITFDHDTGIYGRLYDKDGNPQGDQFEIAQTTGTQSISDVQKITGDRYLVTWHDDRSGNYDVYGKILDKNGATIGDEFQVNEYTLNDQTSPAIAARSDGGFITAWTSGDGQDGNLDGIFMNTYACAGDDQSPQDQVGEVCPTELHEWASSAVNSHTVGDQTNPDVAVLEDGKYVVVWTDQSGKDGDTLGVFGQMYNENDSKYGNEFQINTANTGNQYIKEGSKAVAPLKNGGFVVTYYSEAFSENIAFQIFDKYGNKVGAERTPVNIYSADTLYKHSITSLKNGGFAIIWPNLHSSTNFMYYRIFAADGTPVTEEIMPHQPDYRANPTSLTQLSNGNIVAIWQDDTADLPKGRVYTEAGTAVADEFTITSTDGTQGKYTAVTALKGGGFYVVWCRGDTNENVMGQLFDNEGNKVGQMTKLENTYADFAAYVDAITLSGDDILVSWNDTDATNSPDGSSDGVMSRLLNKHGAIKSDPTVINNPTMGNQRYARLATRKNGGYIAVWQDEFGDNSGYGIRKKTVTCGGADVGQACTSLTESPYIQANTWTTDNQADATITPLQDGGYVQFWESFGQDAQYTSVHGQFFNTNGSKRGSEFQVNEREDRPEELPQATTLKNGNVVVAWSDRDEVYIQIYTPNGEKIGSNIIVNSTTNNEQSLPEIAALANGNMVVVWQSDGQDGSGLGTYGQILSSSGTKIRPEFQVNEYTTGDQEKANIAGLAFGGFVVTWESQYGEGAGTQDGDNGGIFAQIYDDKGEKIGAEFQVNQFTSGNQSAPSVAGLHGGDFVIAWNTQAQFHANYSVVARRYSMNGTPMGDEFKVDESSSTRNYPEITATAGGGYVIAYRSSSSSYQKIYNAYDNVITPEFDITVDGAVIIDLDVTALTDGSLVHAFIPAWDYDGDGTGAYHRLYQCTSGDAETEEPDPAPSDTCEMLAESPEERVNTTTADDQFNPSTTTLNNGGFVITWHSNGQDGNGLGIYAQMYDVNGNTIGNEFQVNTYTSSNQYL